MNREQLRQTIQRRLDEKGLTAKEASLRAVGNTSLIANIGRDRYGLPSIEKLEKLADILDLELYFGPPRPRISPELTEQLQHAMSFSHGSEMYGPDIVATLPDGSIVPIEVKRWSKSQLQRQREGDANSTFARIPLHQATLAAGNGMLNEDETDIQHLAFRRSWLRKIGVSPSNAVLARIADGEMGESMLPSICPGDMVLIDTARKDIPARPRDYKSRKSPIYALATEEGARVKRLATMGGLVILLSDNPDYPPEFLTKETWANLNVIGKVVWWGHTAEE